MDDPLFKILIVFFFVFLNAFFVAAEFAIVTAPAAQIEELARRGRRRARIASYVLRHLDVYLSACQLGITLASLALGWIGEPYVAKLLEPTLLAVGIHSEAALHTTSFAIGFGIITFLHIVLGELAPKSLALRKPLSVSLNSAPPLRLFYIVFYPVIAVMNGAALLILRAVGIHGSEPVGHVMSEAEIRTLISRSVEHGELTAQETRMMEKVLDFHDREAHHIMVPRTDIVFLSAASDAEDNLRIAEGCGYTRFPLCEDGVDRVIGFVHVKDLYRAVRMSDGPVDTSRARAETILSSPTPRTSCMT